LCWEDGEREEVGWQGICGAGAGGHLWDWRSGFGRAEEEGDGLIRLRWGQGWSERTERESDLGEEVDCAAYVSRCEDIKSY
jgi:hypothetical protein